MHDHSYCGNEQCVMDAYLRKNDSTIEASSSTPVELILLNSLLAPAPSLLDEILFKPLFAQGTFALVCDSEIANAILSGEEVVVPSDVCYPFILDEATKEVVRQSLFYDAIRPALDKKGFIVQKDEKDIIDPFSKYDNAFIDIRFYHPQKYFSKNAAVAAGIICRRMKSNSPTTTDTIQAEERDIELKRIHEGRAKCQKQAEAECFLIANDIAALALRNHCCILEKICSTCLYEQ